MIIPLQHKTFTVWSCSSTFKNKKTSKKNWRRLVQLICLHDQDFVRVSSLHHFASCLRFLIDHKWSDWVSLFIIDDRWFLFSLCVSVESRLPFKQVTCTAGCSGCNSFIQTIALLCPHTKLYDITHLILDSILLVDFHKSVCVFRITEIIGSYVGFVAFSRWPQIITHCRKFPLVFTKCRFGAFPLFLHTLNI